MNLVRKTICIVLAVCTMSTACVVFASDSDAAEQSKEEVVMQAAGEEEVSPMTSRIALDASITAAGASWTQPIGYGSYRIWVDNTTDYAMTVIIKGGWGEDEHRFTVGKHSDRPYTINNAGWGRHTVSFDTSSGVYSGTVRVRVSDATLS